MYFNVMEQQVEEEYEARKGELDGCGCDKCKADIICYTLNRLHPRYVVSNQGALYSKMNLGGIQNHLDIIKLIIQAAERISEHPRHGPEEFVSTKK